MVTGKSQPGVEPVQLPATSPEPVGAGSPPSKRDLASWWRQFKRNTRKEDIKEPPRGIFGVPLNESIKYANVAISLTNEQGENFIYGYVPIVVAKCGVFLKEKATDVEGIFRLNGSAKRIKDLQELFDSPERYGKGLDWDGYTVHDAANVLRRYLNQLPEPIVPLEFYERFREPLRVYQKQVQEGTQGTEDDPDKFDHAKAVETYQNLIIELPPLNKQLLLYILDLLAVFASKSEQNRMTSGNLSAIFQPGMLSHPNHDMSPEEYKLSQDVLIFLIENQDHFLVGMNGTKADEQTIRDVQAGVQPRLVTPVAQPTSGTKSPNSTIRRSASSASANTEGHRKLDTLRRNASVSSRNSRNSNTVPSPGTPTSVSGSVHRSNTLPSKMGPVLTSARHARAAESGSANPSALAPSHNSSREASRTPSLREEAEPRPEAEARPEQRNNSQATSTSSAGSAYVHTSTHGPIPVGSAARLSVNDLPHPHENLDTPTSPPPPPQVVTPTRERKLSSLFAKSPPTDREQKDSRQPNRLKKKRIPGSASISAQSSSNSLHGPYEPVSHTHTHTHTASEVTPGHQSTEALGEDTPKPPTAATLNNRDTASDSTTVLVEGAAHPSNNDHSLRPHQSRTPSMNSRSSFTDASDLDQPDDAARSERRDNRRSWRFHRSAKRSSEQVGLGLASPPLGATHPELDHSTSSIASGGPHSNDPSSQPLSLDAGVQGSSISSAEPERRSLFGKFKAKVGLARDRVGEDRERVKSPSHSDSEPSTINQPLSPTANQTSERPTIEVPSEAPKEEGIRSPASPLPGAGLPPSIPEEPHSPEMKSAAPVSAAPAAPAPEAGSSVPVAVSEPIQESTEKDVPKDAST